MRSSIHQNIYSDFLFLYFYLLFLLILQSAQYVFSNDSLFRAGAENSGRLWGYSFGDFAYKSHADSLITWR